MPALLTPSELQESDVTDEAAYLSRRTIIGSGAAVGGWAPCVGKRRRRAATLRAVRRTARVGDKLTSFEDITHYNNFYEFGVGKEDPARKAGSLDVRPWTVGVDGACAKPRRFAIEDLLKRFPIEERIYRHRCVEGWSMVIPWLGFPLVSLLNQVEPTSAARYVRFETLLDPCQMPEQRTPVLEWPLKHLGNPATVAAPRSATGR